MINNQGRPFDKKGFSLIEIIISLVLVGILAAVAGMGFTTTTEGYIFARQNSETVQKAQPALTRIVKELGAATSVSASPAPTTSSITYARPGSDTNNIALSGSTIEMNGVSLINNVTSFSMTYYDAAGNPSAVPAAIRSIDIALTVTGADNQPIIFTNRVCIRESY